MLDGELRVNRVFVVIIFIVVFLATALFMIFGAANISKREDEREDKRNQSD